MSSESPPAAAPTPSWSVLNLSERRILGVLVEKAKTTPDAYPLSINALLAGCNQKTAREPVLNLSDLDVEEALESAKHKGLTMKITGGRVIRWRHNLYEAWSVDKVELAILAELLLRGPQTEGELRSRVSRMEPVDDLDVLRAMLKKLAERRLVVYLTPEGRRGTTVSHGFHEAKELERLKARASVDEPAPAAPPASAVPTRPPADDRVPSLEARLTEANAEIAALRATVAEIQAQVATLAAELRQLKEALGD